MGASMSAQGFRIRQITVSDHGYRYATFQVVGSLNGQRIRKKFKRRELALGEKTRLEVLAANTESEIRAVNTRLTPAQLSQAETAFQRLGDTPLTLAIDWYLASYRPPTI
jgi:hypothetical protein